MAMSAETRAELTFALLVTLLVFAWSTVGLRLWVRLRITKNPGWDDATMVVTLILFTCYCSFLLVIDGRGALDRRPTPELIGRIVTYVQLSEIFYVLTTTTLKISLGLFFLRLLTKRWQLFIFRTLLYLSAVYGIFYFFVAIFQCGAPSRLLESILGNAKCLPDWFLLSTGYLYGIINVIADWTFVVIPIFMLIESDMDRRSKISVSIVMGLGAIGSISSILRMVYLKGLLLHDSIDANAVKATIWATAEPGTGIIAASIAVLRPLYRKITTEVRDKISEYGLSNGSRNVPSALQNDARLDNESMIALTSVVTVATANPKASDTGSGYSIKSPIWDPNVTIKDARIAKAIHISMTTEQVGPPPPPPPK